MNDIIKINIAVNELYNEQNIDLLVLVNGSQIRKNCAFEIFGLVASTRHSGEQQILTCNCGQPECARIYINCIVLHEGERLRWLLPCPAKSDEEMDNEEPYEDGDDERLSGRFDEYYFDFTQYYNEVNSVLQSMEVILAQPTQIRRHCGRYFDQENFLSYLLP